MLTTIKQWLPTIAVMIGASVTGVVIQGQYGWAAQWMFIAGIATGTLMAEVLERVRR